MKAISRFFARVQQSPKTSCAALAALYGVAHAVYHDPAKLSDPAFVGLTLASLATVYGLFEAKDSANDGNDGSDSK